MLQATSRSGESLGAFGLRGSLCLMNFFRVNRLLQSDRAKHRCWSGCVVHRFLNLVGRDNCTGVKKVKVVLLFSVTIYDILNLD